MYQSWVALAAATQVLNLVALHGIPHDQLLLNVLLQRVASHGGPSALRWSLFNPLLAFTGMYTARSPLTVVFHHATDSAATGGEKMQLLNAELAFVGALRQKCLTYGQEMPWRRRKLQEGEKMGPMDVDCLWFAALDPHIAHHVEPYRQGTFGAYGRGSILWKLRHYPVWSHLDGHQDSGRLVALSKRACLSFSFQQAWALPCVPLEELDSCTVQMHIGNTPS
eukprot:TRINITY_DN20931_c0_g1_i3.p1 TRINITY_DN20931_c0_g1~~TRINITY_DN20931_c0_g1_i3.p1  ORF type:complete len:223 (+),score=22.79 TRINITY_DN20931_c0_g1_i3:231-899(+)